MAGELYHRTLTHSLFFALAIGLLFYLLTLGRDSPWQPFGFGLVTGMVVLHSLVDIFVWFDGVGLLWPLWTINLWGWLTLPEGVKRLLRAANFLAFAWYFAYLGRLARADGSNTAYLPRLRRYTYAQFILGLLFSGLAMVLPASVYNILDGAILLLFAYPNALWVTWQMRETIGGEGDRDGEGRQEIES